MGRVTLKFGKWGGKFRKELSRGMGGFELVSGDKQNANAILNRKSAFSSKILNHKLSNHGFLRSSLRSCSTDAFTAIVKL
jgi:hypothetical protein